MKRNERDGYRVQFSFKSRKNVDRTLENINDAIEFRDIIQKKIDDNEDICKVFGGFYKNDIKHISVTKYGKYQLIIRKPALKFDKSFPTIDDAKTKLEELLREYYLLQRNLREKGIRI
jgi:hypothetical protein